MFPAASMTQLIPPVPAGCRSSIKSAWLSERVVSRGVPKLHANHGALSRGMSHLRHTTSACGSAFGPLVHPSTLPARGLRARISVG